MGVKPKVKIKTHDPPNLILYITRLTYDCAHLRLTKKSHFECLSFVVVYRLLVDRDGTGSEVGGTG